MFSHLKLHAGCDPSASRNDNFRSYREMLFHIVKQTQTINDSYATMLSKQMFNVRNIFPSKNHLERMCYYFNKDTSAIQERTPTPTQSISPDNAKQPSQVSQRGGIHQRRAAGDEIRVAIMKGRLDTIKELYLAGE